MARRHFPFFHLLLPAGDPSFLPGHFNQAVCGDLRVVFKRILDPSAAHSPSSRIQNPEKVKGI